jgi:hypothetical protein
MIVDGADHRERMKAGPPVEAGGEFVGFPPAFPMAEESSRTQQKPAKRVEFPLLILR